MARETFNQAFSPYLENTANLLSRFFIGNREREQDMLDWKAKQDYEQKLKNQQALDQADALAKYQAGGETVLTGAPDVMGTKPKLNLKVNSPNDNVVIPERKTQYKNYTPEEKIREGLKAGITSNQILQDLEPPKRQDIYEGYIDKPYQRLARNKYTGQVETIQDYGTEINPAYKFNWKEREIPDSISKGKDGRFYKRMGMFDYDANKWNENDKGEKVISKEVRIPLTKTGTNGEKLFSKEINENFNEYKKDIDTLLNNINQGIDPETGQDATPEVMNKWKSDLGVKTENYSNLVKNTASSRFIKWYKDLFNGTTGNKKKGSNALPLVYWNSLMNDSKKYGFTNKDYQSGYQLFISTYKADPIKLYGVSGFDEYFDNEDTSDVNEEEL